MRVEIAPQSLSLKIKKKKTSIDLTATYSKSISLTDKLITQDGKYYAHEDKADGYSSVNVNVLGNNDFLAKFTTGSSSNAYIDIKMLGDVPENAFNNIKILNLVDLTLSKKILDNAFKSSNYLTNIIAPNPLEIGVEAFYNCSKVSGEITISNKQTEIYDATFRNCNNLNITLHDDIKKIGAYAFYKCELLKITKLPRELTKLGTYAFQNTGITINKIPEGIKEIPSYCFFQCKGIESLKINNNITNIDTYSFRYCINLKLLEIGNGIKTIKNYAFGNCTNLKTIIIHSKQPPTIQSLNTFYNDENLTEIKVPASELETYKSATSWSNYADIMIGIEGE